MLDLIETVDFRGKKKVKDVRYWVDYDKPKAGEVMACASCVIDGKTRKFGVGLKVNVNGLRNKSDIEVLATVGDVLTYMLREARGDWDSLDDEAA